MIAGCRRIERFERADRRGYLCKTVSCAWGIGDECFHSWSEPNVLRGMHWQPGQHKTVICLVGCIYDAIVDMRRDSPTYKQGMLFKLMPDEGIYMPAGVAHGFWVPDQRSLVLYLTGTVYDPERERGIHWSTVDVPWPFNLAFMGEHQYPITSDRDANLPKEWPR